MKTMWMLAAVVALAGCRTDKLKFTCSGDAQCSGGRCIENVCAFPSSSCPSGFKFSRGMNDECAPAVGSGDMAMCSGAGCDMAVGADMTRTTVTWTLEDSSATFRAVWGSGPTNVYAVGDGGTIGHRRGDATWDFSQTSPNYKSSIFQIWGSGPDDIYLSADGSTVGSSNPILIWHTTGGGVWQQQNGVGGAATLLGVSKFNLWAFRRDSSLSAYTSSGDGNWTLAGNSPMASVYSTCTGANNKLFAGQGNYVSRYDNDNQWHRDPTNFATGTQTYALVSAGPTDLYACGDNRGIAHSSGDGTWTVQTQTTGQPTCRGLWSSSSSDVWAVGDAGLVLHSTGNGNWSSVVIPGITTQNLYGIWGSGANDIYIVGASVIMHGAL